MIADSRLPIGLLDKPLFTRTKDLPLREDILRKEFSMTNGSYFGLFKWVVLAYCTSCHILPGGNVSRATEPDQARIAKERRARQKKAVLASHRPYAPPKAISIRDPKSHEVCATLNVRFAVNEIDDVITRQDASKQKVRTRTYNGDLVGGLIRVKPGDLLKVRLNNSIPRRDPDIPYCPNKPNGFNITNLHTHGLHVSPQGNSDNVYLEIGPEESKELCFDIPPNHTAGTFWFHAHRHGSTALQLSSGMAGAIIIDGGLDTVPEIADAMKDHREKILLFEQMTYHLNSQNIGEVSKDDVYGDARARRARILDGTQYEVTLINGINHPVIKMKPGEIQRWRCIHGGILKTLPLTVVKRGQENEALILYEIARDGLPLYRMERVTSVKLYPGYRSDFLIRAPDKAGTYLLKQPSVRAAEALGKIDQEEDYLARVEIEDVPPVSMKLPDPDAICKFALKHIDYEEIFNRKPLPFILKRL